MRRCAITDLSDASAGTVSEPFPYGGFWSTAIGFALNFNHRE
jgi:hypothetical protein